MSEETTEEVIKKAKPFFAKYWYWIILIALIIAGCYLTASYLWRVAHSEKEATEGTKK